jgi:hypothetical protein
MGTEVTLEQVEVLEAELEQAHQREQERLTRLVRAHCRVLAVREPECFERRPFEYCDKPTSDYSFPPGQEWRDFVGPRLLKVESLSWDQDALGGGFYHRWRVASQQPGVYLAPDGSLWGGIASGEGGFRSIAAYPGDGDVRLLIEWRPLEADEITIETLIAAEEHVRELAFPQGVAVFAGS